MTSPAGPCEWCGGPQNWTFIRGEMYVRCVDGCAGLFPEGPVDSPPNSEGAEEFYEGGALLEHSEEEGSTPGYGDDTRGLSRVPLIKVVREIRQDQPLFHGGELWLGEGG